MCRRGVGNAGPRFSMVYDIFVVKLVRDKIPDIPDVRRRYHFQRLETDGQYLKGLKQKLVEESKEAAIAKSKKELVLELIDITEIVNEIRKLLGITVSDMRLVRKKKLKEKGGFSKRLIMLSR